MKKLEKLLEANNVGSEPDGGVGVVVAGDSISVPVAVKSLQDTIDVLKGIERKYGAGVKVEYSHVSGSAAGRFSVWK